MFKWFSILTKIVKRENWLETSEVRIVRLAEQLDALSRTADGLRENVAHLEKTLEDVTRKATGICQNVSSEIEKQNREIEATLSQCRSQVEACSEIARGVSSEISGLSEKIQTMNG